MSYSAVNDLAKAMKALDGKKVRKRKRDGEGSERATNACRREVRKGVYAIVRKSGVYVCVLKNRA